MNKIPMTPQGKDLIEQELNFLITVERENIKKALAEARANGDLSENADYQFAKEKQSLIEGRILYLQGRLAQAQVIDVTKLKGDKIVFGTTVKLFDTEKEKQLVYKIVGEDEADLSKGLISYSSPLAKSLIGKEEGDIVIVKAPKGDIEYEVESIEYK